MKAIHSIRFRWIFVGFSFSLSLADFAFGSASISFFPEALANIAQDSSSNRFNIGSVLSISGIGNFDFSDLHSRANFLCATFDKGSNLSKPAELGVEGSSAWACDIHEIFIEHESDFVQVLAGKSVFEFSNSLLSSPSNPSWRGLQLPSPLQSVEGIWNFQVRLTFSSFWHFQSGFAFQEGPFDGDYLIRGSPFFRIQRSGDRNDLWLVGADRFVGAGLNAQVFDEAMVYAEGNRFSGRDSSMSSNQSRSDFLVGMNWTHTELGILSSVEYLRNADGMNEEAGSDKFRRLFFSGTRGELLPFPGPETHRVARWGATDFLSKDLVLVDVRRADHPSIGCMFSILVSANDRSFTALSGYGFEFKAKSGPPILLVTQWQHFGGSSDSEFGSAGKALGQDHLILRLRMEGF